MLLILKAKTAKMRGYRNFSSNRGCFISAGIIPTYAESREEALKILKTLREWKGWNKIYPDGIEFHFF